MSNEIFLETIMVGPLSVNCYLIGCKATMRAVLIDPGAEKDRIIKQIDRSDLTPEIILLTHGHIDHTAAVSSIKKKYNLKLALHSKDVPMLNAPDLFGLSSLLKAEPCPKPDILITEGDQINVGNLTINVLHTPGHTPGSCCFIVNDYCFCGDTIFAQSIGRTDLPGGSHDELLSSISKKIISLEDSIILYPGHGPMTSIGKERKENPFLSGLK